MILSYWRLKAEELKIVRKDFWTRLLCGVLTWVAIRHFVWKFPSTDQCSKALGAYGPERYPKCVLVALDCQSEIWKSFACTTEVDRLFCRKGRPTCPRSYTTLNKPICIAWITFDNHGSLQQNCRTTDQPIPNDYPQVRQVECSCA